MAERMGRSWSCRLIERVRAARPEWDQGARGERPEFWRRWVERHERGCPHCRAENESWKRVLSRLRPERPASAPPRILDEVMARIALERAARTSDPAGATHLRRSWAKRRRPAGWDPLEQVLFWAVWAFVLGWAGAVRVLGGVSSWAAVRWELWPVLFEGWARAMRTGMDAFSWAVGALPSELQPYVVAGLWCSFGFSVAIASAVLTVRLVER